MPRIRPGRQHHGHTRGIGGAPQLLPLVSAIAVNNVTATSASLVGSVNPQGLSGNWWFAYGTSPVFGSTTTSTALSATIIPQTETVTLTGLTTGQEYWFAMVGSTAAGTVTSAPVTFTPATQQPVTDASNPLISTATPMVAVPHYAYPPTLSTTLGIGIVEQDTLAEVFANVQVIANCPIGACPELSTFGVPELTFGQAPLNPAPVVQAIQILEPRATESSVSVAVGDPDAGTWQIALTTELAESS